MVQGRRGPGWPVMSAATCRAPGAKIADKAAVCLLLAALATLWLFERDYSLDETMHRPEISTQSLALAANLAPEHRFLMFLRQTGATPEERAYVPYNRFPIGAYLAFKAALLPFGPDLAAQIRAAQSVTLLFFAGAAVLAYRALRRLRHGPWVALTATLLAFSSFHSLHYADMISSEIASLCGIWLTAYGLVRFAHDGRLRPLLLKAGVALLLGWHVMGLLLPFVVLGLTQAVRRAYAPGAAAARARLRLVLGSPYLRLGLAAALLCAALLAFNVANEYVALKGETPWTQLPTVQSFLHRAGLQGSAGLLGARSVGLSTFAAEQLQRIGRLTAPYALVRGLGYEHYEAPTFFMATGLAVCGLCCLSLRGARPRRVRAAWLLAGWIWVLAVPGSAHWHEFEALFHLGIPLLFFAQSLQGLRRRGLPAAGLPVAAVAALALFSLSAREVSRRLPTLDEFPGYRATLADFTTIRSLVAGRSVCVPAHLASWAGVDGRHEGINPLSYYLAGSQVDYRPDDCASSASDFMLAPVRVEGAALLTPANRAVFLYAVPALEETPYRAALRALRSAAPLARAEFDLYAHAQALVYYRPTACRPADREARFFLSVEPVRVQDLPAHRQQFGFDNLNFNWRRRGLQFKGQCLALAPLPAYPIARIRTGQFTAEAALWETAFPFRPTYEAALRAVQTAAPLARAAFDVHARARTLIYYQAACDPAAVQTSFFLHVEPVHIDDLPAHRRAHGFDNRDFDGTRRGMHLDRQCLALAPLPAYPIARIRTGQGARGGDPLWATEFPFRPTYEEALRAVQAAAPLARAEFDVYARARTLLYYQAACDPAAPARFFLHLEPVRVRDLPAHRRAHGFDNRDFDFARRGMHLDPQCLALVPLPRYPIARIRTGQGARADGANWEVEVRLPARS